LVWFTAAQFNPRSLFFTLHQNIGLQRSVVYMYLSRIATAHSYAFQRSFECCSKLQWSSLTVTVTICFSTSLSGPIFQYPKRSVVISYVRWQRLLNLLIDFRNTVYRSSCSSWRLCRDPDFLQFLLRRFNIFALWSTHVWCLCLKHLH